MMDGRIAKPPPAGPAIETSVWTAPFWEAAARHELRLARCAACGLHRMPPTPFCPRCHAQGIEWVAAPGEPQLYSYTVVERAIVPGTEDALPYVPAIVSYAEADGVRLITNVVGSRLGDLAVGAALLLDWHDLPGGGAIPVYRLA